MSLIPRQYSCSPSYTDEEYDRDIKVLGIIYEYYAFLYMPRRQAIAVIAEWYMFA